MKLKLDLHVHSEKSFDCVQSLDDIVKACKERGIDGACICDHDESKTDFEIRDGILLIPGVELSTEYGHILGLFLNSPVNPERDFEKAVTSIHKAGGLAFFAHPFEKRKKKKSETDKMLSDVISRIDGIETQNSRCELFVKNGNDCAKEIARKLGAVQVGGSDGHTKDEIGNSITEIEVDTDKVEKVTLLMLKTALADGKTTVEKIRTTKKSAIVKSQFIRHKKTKLEIRKWIKYIAFVVRLYLLPGSVHK